MAGKILSRRSCHYVLVATLIAVLALCVLEVHVLSTSRPRAAVLSSMTGLRYLLLADLHYWRNRSSGTP